MVPIGYIRVVTDRNRPIRVRIRVTVGVRVGVRVRVRVSGIHKGTRGWLQTVIDHPNRPWRLTWRCSSVGPNLVLLRAHNPSRLESELEPNLKHRLIYIDIIP